MAMTAERQMEGAKNQAFFRDVNERVAEASPGQRETLQVLCECADTGCVAQLAITRDGYDAVRGIPTHFPVKPHHVYPEIERVVDRTAGYWIVEKFGESGKAAVELDPRRRDAGTDDS